jgi:hypothetical protein
MAILDQIGQDKRRISERLMRLDAERTKLNDQLSELEIAERALSRFGGKGVATEKRRRGRVTKTATVAVAEPKTRARRQAPQASLGEATLKAVQAHAKGASADEVLKYLVRKFGLRVRPNHLGSALQRHRRAGRLENRDQRWYAPTPA